MIRTKICGIQSREDALAAAAAGADFIGLVFVPKRRRRLEVEAAAEIVRGLRADIARPPKTVGLFADQPFEEVAGAINSCKLDLVQLCGRESPDYCRRVMLETEARVIKVLHVPATETAGGDAEIEARLRDYQDTGCRVTLDRLVEGLQGGTGQSFDWAVAAELSRKGYEFLLAGGLTPNNVGQAVAQARPWGVDVSSGVETDGRKDPGKIRAFIQNARDSNVD